ncbi:MAG: hypothetical protein JNL88_08685 [Bacteroidia bacterium]|nr:hypothetical protein [Bacteroidia bacterium]
MSHATRLLHGSIILLLTLRAATLNAQPACTLCGSYYLEGVMETASGFNVKADSSFEFFFSSGALDRYGSGRWEMLISEKKDTLLAFTAHEDKGTALKMLKSERRLLRQSTLQVQHINQLLNSYFIFVGFEGRDSAYSFCNPEGEAVLEGDSFDSLQVIFELCPDHRLSIYPEKANNYFEVDAEPWLFEIFFKRFYLLLRDETLLGKHPMLDGNFVYRKN